MNRFSLILFFSLWAVLYVKGQNADSKVLIAFETKDYVICVDSLLTEGMYRYSSWKKNKSLQSSPDIEIMGNNYDSEKQCFIFIIGDVVEGEYDYIVYDNKRKGWSGIIVTLNQKVILKQEKKRNIDFTSPR